MENPIEILRKVFTVSLAAFEFTKTVREATGGKYEPTKMHLLHIEMHEELSKTEPDTKTVDTLLEKMERLAEFNSHPR